MSGKIMYNEAEVNNILAGVNAACTNLQSSINDLDGIDADASSLGLANFNTSQVQGSINSCKEKINNIIVSIYNVVKDVENVEGEILNMLIELFSTLPEEDALKGMNEILSKKITIEELETTGVSIWKDGVEYKIVIERISGHRCIILEPENADPNIPTVFILDGDGNSAVSYIKDDVDNDSKIIGAIEGTMENGYDGGQSKKIPLSGIYYGGLTKPNARFIYLPNNGTKWTDTETEVFEGIVEELVGTHSINTGNMTIVGHSSRGIFSSKICSRIKIHI